MRESGHAATHGLYETRGGAGLGGGYFKGWGGVHMGAARDVLQQVPCPAAAPSNLKALALEGEKDALQLGGGRRGNPAKNKTTWVS